MFTSALPRRARLGIMAGALAATGVGVALFSGAANAADSEIPVKVDFSQTTKVNSVNVFVTEKDGSWTSACETREPATAVQDTGLLAHDKAGEMRTLVQSFVTGDCTGATLHEDTLTQDPAARMTPWLIAVRSLDDDDPIKWTQ